MSDDPPPAASSLAERLRPLLRSRKAQLTLEEIVAQVDAGGGLGPVLFVLTLPVLLPLPPGVSMVLALPLLMVALQVVAGRRRLWLPRTMARRSLRRADLAKVLHRVLPPLDWLEKAMRPRLGFLTGGAGSRMVGLACTLMAAILILPIPFANLAPALALGFFSLGLTRKDGVLVLVGYALLALTFAVIALGVHGIVLGLHYLRAML